MLKARLEGRRLHLDDHERRRLAELGGCGYREVNQGEILHALGSARLCLPKTPYALRRLRLRAFSDSLHSWRPSSSRCSTRFGSWSGHAPRCTWKSSRSDTSSRVVNRSRRPRLRFTPADRMLWAWLSQAWRGWRSAVHIVKPETVIGVAPARLSSVLDLEEPTAHRAPGRATRRSRPDPRAVHRESALGCAADSRGAAEVGDLGESVDRRQVHAAASAPAVTNVADLPHQPREPDHGRRPVRRADGHVPAAVRARHPRARPSTDRPRGGHRASHRGLDRTAASQRLPGRTRRPDISCTIAMRSLPTSRPPSPP